MEIYIPSRSRADQKHHTFDTLPGHFKEKAKFVVHESERDAYAARFGKKHILATTITGIGPVRQLIIQKAKRAVLMLDDDLSFFARRDDDPTKLRKATDVDVTRMLCDVAELMETEFEADAYAHVAIAVREGANRNTDPILYNTRCLRALGYRADILRREKIRFDRLPVMEDFDVALQLLRKGYDSATLNTYAQDQGQSNAAGGCSTYRSMEVQAQGAQGLAKLHPDFVRVVQKEAKSGAPWATRLDVQVAWKKARASA